MQDQVIHLKVPEQTIQGRRETTPGRLYAPGEATSYTRTKITIPACDVEIVISGVELEHIARKAARNRSHRARSGPVTATARKARS